MDQGGGDWMAVDVDDIQDVDLEVYGKEKSAATSRISSYSFEVRMKLILRAFTFAQQYYFLVSVFFYVGL